MSRKRKRRPSQRRPKRRYQEPQRSSGGGLRLTGVIAILIGVNLYVFLWRGGTSIPAVMEKAAVAGEKGEGALLPSDQGELVAQAQTPSRRAEPGARIGTGGPEAAPTGPGREVEGEVQPGDSMGLILRKQGMSAGAADELIRSLGETLDFRKIRAGQSYRLYFDGAGVLLRFEFDMSKTTTIKAIRGADGKLKAETVKAQTELRQEAIGGEIRGSLYRSMKRAGEDTSLVSFFVDVFAYDLNFFVDTHPGDLYRLIVEKEYLNGEFLGYGRVLAAEYSGKAGTYRAFWWKQPGSDSGKYYNEKGESVEKTFLKTPLKFARVSSKFNPKRMHPVLHVKKGHWGVDYAAPPGTPIWSAAPGRITFRGPRGGAGNCVIVKHDNGLQTIYMHMSKFAKGQRVGTRVRAKDVIGYVGSTGLATGPHLHFGVKKNGHYIDPMKMKMTRGVGVSRKHMASFKSDSARLVQELAGIETEAPRKNPFLVHLNAG